MSENRDVTFNPYQFMFFVLAWFNLIMALSGVSTALYHICYWLSAIARAK